MFVGRHSGLGSAHCMDRIKEFPQDGRLWWICWVDHVLLPLGRTGSPGITVLLSALPDGANVANLPPIEGELRRQRREFSTIQVLAGAVTGLTIGTVFQNGLRVGLLKAEEVSFSFGVTDDGHRSAILPLRSNPDLSPPPHWWSPRRVLRRRPRPLLPPASYALPGFDDVLGLLVRDDTRMVLLPCFEIFRAFYAAHQDVALALLSGPWDVTWHEVANPDHTGILDDNVWQIGLRRRIRNKDAPTLANLILNPYGRKAANDIHAHLLGKRLLMAALSG